MLNRKFAGFAAGALTAGVMAVPALLAPANAAAAPVTYDGTFECSGTYSSYTFTMAYAPGLTVSADGTAVTATSVNAGGIKMDGGAALPAGFKLEGVEIAIDAKLNAEDVALTGSSSTAAGAGVDPSADVVVPALSGTRTSTQDLAYGVIKSVSGGVTIRVPYGPPGGIKATVPMTCTGAGVEIPAPVTAPEGGALFDCDIPAFTTSIKFPTAMDLTAQAKGGNVTVSLGMGAIPIKTVPVPLASTPIEGVVKATIDGQAVDLTGSDLLNIPANTDIPVPAVSGTVASTKGSVDVVVESATFLAKHPLMNVDVACTLTEAFSKTVDVKAEAKPPVVKPAATKSVTKATYKKKAKKAVIKTTVKAGKKNATGKVTITVKKGKKVVAKKTVTLKKGQATLVLKKGKLKKKGVYTVTAKYTGNKSFKKSGAKKVTFRVK